MDPEVLDKRITVVVVYRNEESNLPELLNSISSSSNTNEIKQIDFLFINNASTDRSEDLVNQWIKDQKMSAKNINRSINNMGAARQQSLEESQTPWVAFIDADSILEEDWFINALKVIDDSDEKTCAIGGVSSYRVVEKWHAYVLPLWNYFPIGKISGRKVKVSHVPTNNYILNRNKAFRAQGFDSFFSHVGEDLDINVRLNKFGDVYYDSRFLVYHKLPTSVLAWYTKMALYGRAQSTVFIKYQGGVALEKVIPFVMLSLLLGIIYFTPEAALILISVSLLIERVRFYFLTFLFYGLGEFVGFIKTIFTLPRHNKNKSLEAIQAIKLSK